jgi:hypothetical protein
MLSTGTELVSRLRVRRVRAHPVLNPAAVEEAWGERAGYAADPGATGELIPLLSGAARYLHCPALAERAEYAARWELELQLPSGAVRGGAIGERTAPAVFNTGQVLLAWLAAFGEMGAGIFAGAARRAAWFLFATLGEVGVWRQGASAEARPHAALYNARTAWALAEAGRRLRVPEFRAAGAKALRAVARRQHDDGAIRRGACPDDLRSDGGPPRRGAAWRIRRLSGCACTRSPVSDGGADPR